MDAPVGRTSREAEQGTLLIMVGGDTEDVERAHPVLECMGDTIIHCGRRPAPGSVPSWSTTTSRSFPTWWLPKRWLWRREPALDRDTVIEVLMGTTAGRGHLGTTYPAKALAGDLEPGFMVDLALKDLGLALEMSAHADSPAVMGAAALPVYDEAHRKGPGAAGLDRHLQHGDRQETTPTASAGPRPPGPSRARECRAG